MATSQKEFIVGCLVGGALGAFAALLMPKKLLNGINGVTHKLSSSTHHHNIHHKGAESRASVKSFTVKKSKARKTVKRTAKKIAKA